MKVTHAATEYVVHMYVGIIGPRHAILKSTTRRRPPLPSLIPGRPVRSSALLNEATLNNKLLVQTASAPRQIDRQIVAITGAA